MHSFCCACPTRQFCDPPSELLLDLTGSIPGYRAYLLGQSLRGSPACTIGNTTPRKGSHFGISGPPQRDPSALGLAPPGGNPGEIRGGSHAPRPPPRDHGRATKRVSSASRRPADVYTQSTPPSPPHSPERDGNPWHPQAAPPRGRGCCGGAAGAQAGPPRRRRRPPRCSGGGGVQRRGRVRAGDVLRSALPREGVQRHQVSLPCVFCVLCFGGRGLVSTPPLMARDRAPITRDIPVQAQVSRAAHLA